MPHNEFPPSRDKKTDRVVAFSIDFKSVFCKKMVRGSEKIIQKGTKGRGGLKVYVVVCRTKVDFPAIFPRIGVGD